MNPLLTDEIIDLAASYHFSMMPFEDCCVDQSKLLLRRCDKCKRDAADMLAYILTAVAPAIGARALDGARKELQAAYKRGPGWNLQESSPSGWRKGMSKAHRIVRDYQEALTKEQS